MRPQNKTRVIIFLFLTGLALAMTDYRERRSGTPIGPHLDDSYDNYLDERQKEYERRRTPEPWIKELLSHTKDIPYAQARVSAEESGEYDIKWQEFETREAFLADRELEAGPEYILSSVSYPREWTFIKFQLDDDDHVSDVFHYIKENTPSSKFILETKFSEGWRSISILQNWKLSPMHTRQTILLDNGCLYLLRCENAYREDLQYISSQLYMFITKNFGHYANSHETDEESLYWFDHQSRLTVLENPDRSFLRVQAKALTRTDQGMRRYGMLTKASYRIPVPGDSDSSVSRLEIRFHFAKQIPETGYVHGKNDADISVHTTCPQEPYIMEVWAIPESGQTGNPRVSPDAPRKKLLQRTEVALIGASDDPVRFEDVNKDGFPDLSIDRYCPLHGFYNDDLDPHYWLWNPAKTCFEPLTDQDLQQQDTEDRIRGNLADGNSVSIQVSEGDTLWTLAEKYYGSGSYYKEIYLHNREHIGSDPNHLPSGLWLTLPPMD